MEASDLNFENPGCRESKPDSDTVSLTTKIPDVRITVKGDEAVLQGLCIS